MLNENIISSHKLLDEYKDSKVPNIDVAKERYNESIKKNYELSKILKHLRKSVKKLGKIS